MKFLGIDPGFDRLGIAVIEKASPKPKVIFSVCFMTDKEAVHGARLLAVAEVVREIIQKYKPDSAGIEKLFFAKNQKTAIGVAEARGVILAELARVEIPVREYSPNEIKLAVTGYGASDKQAVLSFVPKQVELEHVVKSDDEMDAIAVALTHLAHSKIPTL